MPSPPEDVVAFTSAHSRSYTALAAMHREQSRAEHGSHTAHKTQLAQFAAS